MCVPNEVFKEWVIPIPHPKRRPMRSLGKGPQGHLAAARSRPASGRRDAGRPRCCGSWTACTMHSQQSGSRRGKIHVKTARSIFSNAPSFRRSAIAPLVHSPWRYCPFRLPGGAPLPGAPPCNRHRPLLVAGHRQGFPLLVRAPHRRAF
jgi:hypothetical protein